MTAVAQPLARRAAAGGGLALAGGLAVGLPLGLAVAHADASDGRLAVACAGALATLALAVVRHDAAVWLGFALLGAVAVEPAPTDGVLALAIAVAVARGRANLRHVPPVVPVLIGALAGVSVLSAVDAVDGGRVAVFLGSTLYLAALALWLTGYVASERRARLIAGGYLVAAVGSALLAVVAMVAPLPGTGALLEAGRARALFDDPNVFGAFLVPAVLVLLEELVSPRLLRARTPVRATLLALVVLGVLFSYSRGAWLNLAAGTVVVAAVLALRAGGARRTLSLVAIAAVGATLVAGAVIATGSTGLLIERARPQAYDVDRFDGQRAGVAAGLAHPLGVGPGQFESLVDISAHSTYVRVLAEQGLAGLALLVALLAVTLAAAAANAARGRSTHGIGSAALAGAWCGLLLNSLVIDTLHWRHLWIVAALVWVGAARGRERR